MPSLIKSIGSIAIAVTMMFSAACAKNTAAGASAPGSGTAVTEENGRETMDTDTTQTEQSVTEAETVNEQEYIDSLKDKKVIALTFDDGPNTTTTSAVLDLVEQYGIKVSFFVIGQNINAQSAEVMKRAYSLGCEINSHSYTHSYMDKMTAEEIRDEMERTAQLIYDNVGEYPKFFRPPYIAVNSTMYENIDIPFISGIGCNDWDDRVTVEKRVKFVTEKCGDGCIVLLHDAAGNSKTAEALKEIIPRMLEEGYVFVTTDELFKVKGIVPSADKEIIYSYATETGWTS